MDTQMMSEHSFAVYLDGEIVPESEAKVPIDDPGFQWGHNIYDLLITVNHEPYDLDEHVDRTFASCRAANIPLAMTTDELGDVVRTVVDTNASEIGDSDDFMVFISVSGGWNVYRGEPETPRVIVSVEPIPYAQLARDFIDGKTFVTTNVRQLSNDSISPLIKHRSRLHFVLADIEAKQIDANADPLLLDRDGNVTETAIGNVFVVTDGVLYTPPAEKVLSGITRDVTLELARDVLEIPTAVENLQLYDVYDADEVFWTNTSHFLTPITSVDGRTIGTGRPGRITERLLDAHSERAGLDIVERFLTHLDPSDRPNRLRLGGDKVGTNDRRENE